VKVDLGSIDVSLHERWAIARDLGYSDPAMHVAVRRWLLDRALTELAKLALQECDQDPPCAGCKPTPAER
jgi:hypothetical protein